MADFTIDLHTDAGGMSNPASTPAPEVIHGSWMRGAIRRYLGPKSHPSSWMVQGVTHQSMGASANPASTIG